MLDFDPLNAEAPEGSPLRRAWTGVASSTAVHLLLVGLVLWVERPQRFLLTRPVDSLQLAQQNRRQVNMVYLTQPRPKPLPPAIKVGPQQPHPVTPPEPPAPPTPPPPTTDPNKTLDPAAAPSAGDVGSTPKPPEAPSTPVPAPPVHHMRSLAFHPGEFASPLTPPNPDPVWRQPPDLGTIGNRCVPGPKPVHGPSDPIKYGVVAGRVYRQGSDVPLVGADLQVIGTPYRTVSDSNGDYVLRFDADLLANCQVQNVQVTADGFISQNLILTSGPSTRNDINLRASR